MFSQMWVGIGCLAVFALMAAMMYTRRLSALLALPIMALLIAVIGGIPPADILSEVANKGATKLNGTYTTTMFGAVLAELVNKQGIAKAVVRWVAEFAGDNPFILGLVLTFMVAVLFSTLGGLGAVIMVGTIVLPVMLSIGISNVAAGALFLFGISLGGMFNIASWQLYVDILKIAPEDIIFFVSRFAGVIGFIVIGFLAVELKDKRNLGYVSLSLVVLLALFFNLSSASVSTSAVRPSGAVIDAASVYVAAAVLAILSGVAMYRHQKNVESNPSIALISPVLPLILVLFFHWDFIPAFIAGITYCVLCTWKHNSISVLTRAILDGISAVVPAIVLMIGIGMLITAVSHKAVSGAIEPLLVPLIPRSSISYIVAFTLMAPLALYRGPLSLWGMGSGLVALVLKVSALSAQAIMGMLLSVGQLQGICDPTNTANIWIATYLGTDTLVLLRKTLLYAWLAAFLGLGLAVLVGYVHG